MPWEWQFGCLCTGKQNETGWKVVFITVNDVVRKLSSFFSSFALLVFERQLGIASVCVSYRCRYV